MNRPPKNSTSVTRNTHMPERRRLALLRQAVEVVRERRVVGLTMAVGVRRHDPPPAPDSRRPPT